MEGFDATKLDKINLGHSEDMKAYISKLVNELRNDIEVYEQIKVLNLTLGEVRDNIAKLTDFKDDYNYCKSCPGIDKCAKHIPHVKMSVKKEGNYISTSYEPCALIMEKIRIDNKYLRSDFPEEWRGSSLKTIDKNAQRNKVIREFQKVLDGESNKWIYVTGNRGVGKSFLLVTLANAFASFDMGQVAVAKTSSLVQSLSDLSYQDKEEFARQMVLISRVPLLVLDDFGEEYKNEYIRDQIILPILNERDHGGRITMFASSFTIGEIQEMYSIGKNGGHIRGKQLGNILTSMCKEFDLTGVSIYKK